jgi:hypothetical protein
MPRVGFESTIPVFEQAKIFRALDRADPAIGLLSNYMIYIRFMCAYS